MAYFAEADRPGIESRNWFGEADTVLEAAAGWVAALEALVAVKQVSEEVEVEQEAVDLAGTRLVAAVNRWRSSREPRG